MIHFSLSDIREGSPGIEGLLLLHQAGNCRMSEDSHLISAGFIRWTLDGDVMATEGHSNVSLVPPYHQQASKSQSRSSESSEF